MPFKSKAQARFMFSQKPEMAKEWASKTKSIKALPDRIKKKKREIACMACKKGKKKK